MAKRKIFIDRRTGDVVALCDNIIDNIPTLGTKTIHRVADVEFNNVSKEWEIVDCKTKAILGSRPRRDEAIALEIELMTERIKDGFTNKTDTPG